MKNLLKNGSYFLLFVLFAGCSDHGTSPGIAVSPNDFLSSKNYNTLVIEIVSVTGYEPSTSTVNNLKTFLGSRLNKPSGINVVQTSIASPGKSTYSLDDVVAVEALHRTQKTSGQQLTAWFFFADGDYSGNSGNSQVLGFAYSTSSMALFEKTIKNLSGGVSQPSNATLETTVMEHEFGHIMGLVNNGTSLQSAHQDSANGKHCSNQNCLMYFSVETSDVVSNLLGGSVPVLDAACLADLQGNGGK